jgi:cell division protein FtsB
MTHPDFEEIIAALEPFAETWEAKDAGIAELEKERDALNARIVDLEAKFSALQSSDAYQEARAMWHVGGVLTEAGEEHLAQSFAWKDARIAELESALATYREKWILLCLERDALAAERDALQKEIETIVKREADTVEVGFALRAERDAYAIDVPRIRKADGKKLPNAIYLVIFIGIFAGALGALISYSIGNRGQDFEALFFGTLAAVAISLVIAVAGTYLDRRRARENAAYLAALKDMDNNAGA